MKPSREKARLYDREEVADVSSAKVISAAKNKLQEAAKQESGLGRELKEQVLKEGPVKEVEAEYMLDQLDALGLDVERSRPRSAAEIDSRVRQQMLERYQGRVLNTRAEVVGNIGNRLGSPGTSAGINAAALNAEAKERARMRREEEEAEEEEDFESDFAGGDDYRRRREKDMVRRQAGAAEREISQEGGGGIGAFSYFLLFIILVIAVISDLLDYVMDITAIGALFAPVKSMIVGAVLAILWWMVGGRSRSKNVKRMIGAVGIDALPILNILPAETLSTVICIYLTIKSDNKDDFAGIALPSRNNSSGGVGNAA